MEELKLGKAQARFADIIWKNEPLSSRTLVAICKEELDWKKSTTYTVLKQLSEKGLFRNEGGIVSSQITQEEYASAQCEKFVEDTFGGSLAAFLTAYTRSKKLSDSDVAEIQKMIQQVQSK